MNRLLTTCFCWRFLATRGSRRQRCRRRSDPAKLQLASANVVVIDAAAQSSDLRQGGRRRDADRVAHQADDRDGRARRQAAARRDDRRSTWTTSTTSRAAARGCGWAPTLSRARNAAARADVVGESRGVVARAPLSRRHARFRRGDERQGAALGMTHTHYADPTGLSAENVSTANDLAQLVQRGRRVSADPRVHDDAGALRRSAADGPDARLQQYQRAGEERGVGHPAAEDRLHPRGRQVPGDARHHRQPADRDRAARLARQVHAHWRRAARQALARDRRVARDRRAEGSGGRRRRASASRGTFEPRIVKTSTASADSQVAVAAYCAIARRST